MKGLDVVHAAEDFEEAAEAASDVDDYYCEAVRKATPALAEVAKILAPVLEELDREEAEQRVYARSTAERESAQAAAETERLEA
jgi:hypothetical protein